MAPAITHFLLGAALVLFVAALFSLRYDIDRAWAIWLVIAGGLWGLFPDLYHIAPVFGTELSVVHDSTWANVFGLHSILDSAAIRTRYETSVFGSIALFIAAGTSFWMASVVRDWTAPRSALDRALRWVAGATIVPVLAGTVAALAFIRLG